MEFETSAADAAEIDELVSRYSVEELRTMYLTCALSFLIYFFCFLLMLTLDSFVLLLLLDPLFNHRLEELLKQERELEAAAAAAH